MSIYFLYYGFRKQFVIDKVKINKLQGTYPRFPHHEKAQEGFSFSWECGKDG